MLHIICNFFVLSLSNPVLSLIFYQLIVLVSDYILGGPSVIQPPEMPAQPPKKESEEVTGEEVDEKGDKEEMADKQDGDTEKSGMRKRVCISKVFWTDLSRSLKNKSCICCL